MAKVKLKLDKDYFQKVISDLEAEQTFKNRSWLWKAVEATDWAKSQHPRPLLKSSVAKYAEDLNLIIKTPTRKKKGGKLKTATQTTEFSRNQNEEVPKSVFRKAVRDKCLDCSGGSRENVANCHVTCCPLFNLRPFKGTEGTKNVQSL